MVEYMEYDTPIKFKGDIIITDPCYLMRKEDDSICRNFYPKLEYPDQIKYFPYGTNKCDYPDFIEQEVTLTNSLEDIEKAGKYMNSGDIDILQHLKLGLGRIKELTFTIKKSPMYEASKKEYEKARTEYFSTPHDDWDYCNYGTNMGKLGFTHGAVASTLYGDWGCTTYEIEDEVATPTPNKVNKKPLGKFCADAGLVGVFLVDEVMKYNPKAVEKLKEKDWCATFIDGFDGDITFAKINDEYGDTELRLVGNGNIKFFTTQTSL